LDNPPPWLFPRPADLEIGDAAGLETCATGMQRSSKAFRPDAWYALERFSTLKNASLRGRRGRASEMLCAECGIKNNNPVSTANLQGSALHSFAFGPFLQGYRARSYKAIQAYTRVYKGIQGYLEKSKNRVFKPQLGRKELVDRQLFPPFKTPRKTA
jgi:hypothetical protein